MEATAGDRNPTPAHGRDNALCGGDGHGHLPEVRGNADGVRIDPVIRTPSSVYTPSRRGPADALPLRYRAGIRSVEPARIRSPRIPFAERSAVIETPCRFAILVRLSPLRTL
ncbi:hypothetical protein BH23GEM3_BH23GEM3_16510 [soil metagenome]